MKVRWELPSKETSSIKSTVPQVRSGKDVIALVCRGQITGLGFWGEPLAIDALVEMKQQSPLRSTVLKLTSPHSRTALQFHEGQALADRPV